MSIFLPPKVLYRFKSVFLFLSFFSILLSNFSLKAQVCTVGVGGGLNKLGSGDICANSAVTPAIMQIDANNVNDAGNPAGVTFSIDWNDGTPAIIISQGIGVNTIQNIGPQTYRAIVNHFFPANSTGVGTVKCIYRPTVTLLLLGVPCSNYGPSPPSFVRWNTDDQNTGVLNVSENVTSANNFLVCAGATTTVFFTDRTTLNCLPAPPTLTVTSANLGDDGTDLEPTTGIGNRWRRFVYGTGGTNIASVLVNAVAVPYPFNGTAVPDASPYTPPPPGTIALPTPTNTFSITIPPTAIVGQIFEITMEYWNVCNPYSGGSYDVAGTDGSVRTTARITVVAQPAAPVGSTQTVCNGTTPGNFIITGAQAGSTVRWYANVSGTTPKTLGTVGALITTTTANGGGVGTLPITTAFPTFTNTAADNYIVWASYSRSAGVGSPVCESIKVPVTRTIKEALAAPVPTGPISTCNGSTETYSLPPPLTNTLGGATQYTWSKTDTDITINSPNAASTTVDFNLPVSLVPLTRTINVVRSYTTGAACTSSIGSITVTVNPLPTAANPTGGGAVCAGNPAPDISWVLTGTGPFDITYEIAGVPTTVLGWPSSPFTITAPTSIGTYEMTALTDAKGCDATTLGATTSVTVGGTPPATDSGPTLSSEQECFNASGVPDPVLNFSLDDLNSANSAPPHFKLIYRIDLDPTDRTKIFATNGVGNPIVPVSFSDVELNAVGGHKVNLISLISPTGCLTNLGISLDFNVRALPIVSTPANQSVCNPGNASFTVIPTGTNMSFQWQEQLLGVGAFTNITDGGIYSGATTSTLTLTGAVLSMSTNRYRVIVTGYNPPSLPPLCPVTSNPAILTVNPLPTVVDQTPIACSDTGAGTTATIPNLAVLQPAIDGSPSRSFAWFENYDPMTKIFSMPIQR
jgi:hypothetical protein